MRKQIGESSKAFPASRSAGETTVETTIDHEILPDRVTDCPKISDRRATSQWLSKMPKFARHGKLTNPVRNGQCLGKLGLTDLCSVVLLFHHEAVDIEMKARQIGA